MNYGLPYKGSKSAINKRLSNTSPLKASVHSSFCS